MTSFGQAAVSEQAEARSQTERGGGALRKVQVLYFGV